MGISNNGISAYLATMNYNSSRNNVSAQNSYYANNVNNVKQPDSAKDEGQAENNTKIPPANDVGRIMDFKV